MAHEKVHVICENLCLEEGMTKGQIESKFATKEVVNSLASGSPLVASSVSEMTDTTRVYVNTTDGHWYWYNGSNWVDGGVYQAAEDSETVEELKENLNELAFVLNATYVKNNNKRYRYLSNTSVDTADYAYTNAVCFDVSKRVSNDILFTGLIVTNIGNFIIIEKNNGTFEKYENVPSTLVHDYSMTLPDDATKVYMNVSNGKDGSGNDFPLSVGIYSIKGARDRLDQIVPNDNNVEIGGTKKAVFNGGVVANKTSEFYSTRINPELTDLNISMNDFTGDSKCQLTDGKWIIQEGGIITCQLNALANAIYLISMKANECYTPNEVICELPISIEDDSIDIFGANDANFNVALKATTTGVKTLSIGGGNYFGTITEISVKKLENELLPVSYNNGKSEIIQSNNVALGNGLSNLVNGEYNTALGVNAQSNINTGVANVAIGHLAQYRTTNGSYNVAVGQGAQKSLKTGMYNFCVGYASQESITNGCWNVAMGNETQRDMTTGCNNVAIGRRAQNDLTTGMGNVAIGAQAAFARGGEVTTFNTMSTKTAKYQTLVGFQATQYDETQSDELVAIGSKANGSEGSVAVGANASARGINSIAIGNGAIATEDNEVVIGNKVIHFNADGTVTWTTKIIE